MSTRELSISWFSMTKAYLKILEARMLGEQVRDLPHFERGCQRPDVAFFLAINASVDW